MTIFEKKFFLSDQRSKVKFYASPTQTPAYDSVYPRFFGSFRTTLASSGGYVSQLKISYKIPCRGLDQLALTCYKVNSSQSRDRSNNPAILKIDLLPTVFNG